MIIQEKEFIPVIIGGDANAYAIARSFHMEYQVKSVVVSKALIGATAYSKIIENVIEKDLSKDDVFVETLSNLAKKNEGKKLILIGTGDWYVEQILRNEEKLKENYIIPSIGLDLMQRLNNKDSFYELCDELGIDYPQTLIYNLKTEKSLVVDPDFDYPVIVKPADDVLYHEINFKGKKKCYKAKNRKELKKIIEKLEEVKYNGQVIIQEFIGGDDSNMRVLTCYCDRESRVKLIALGHVLLEEHTPTAIGNHVAITSYVDEELFEKAKIFLEHVNYKGFAHFDIKYDQKDGKYKFFEINTRLGRNNFYVTGSGENVAKFIVNEYIYSRRLESSIAKDDFLSILVPKRILFSYLKDKELKEKVIRLIKEKKVCNPLLYKGDKSIKRLFIIYAGLLNQFKKYAISKRSRRYN